MVALAGCRGPASTVSAPDLFTVSTARPEPSIRLEAEDLFPLQASEARWTLLEDGTLDTWTCVPERDGSTMHEGGHRTMSLRRSADGGRELVATDKPEDGARTVFDPPLRLCGPSLAAGETVQSSCDVRLLGLPEGGEKDRGTAVRRMWIAGRASIEVPGIGRMDTVEVRSTLETRLGMATARVQSTRWILPGRGSVAERRVERVSVMGLSTGDRVRTLVRNAGNPAAAVADPAQAP